MPCIRETTLTFFVRYLKPKLVQPKLNFGRIFHNSVLLNSGVMAVGIGSSEVDLFIDLLKNLPIMR